MKRSILVVCFLVSWASATQAEILDFESPQIDTCAEWGIAPTGWTIEGESAAVSDESACITINTDGAFSGTQYLLNFNSRVGTLVNNSGAFDLSGFYAHADDRYEPTTIRFAGLNDSDQELFSTTVLVGMDWQFVPVNWPGITKFTWDPISPDVTNISIDDLLVNLHVTKPVPAVSLFGLFMIIIGVLAMASLGMAVRTKR